MSPSFRLITSRREPVFVHTSFILVGAYKIRKRKIFNSISTESRRRVTRAYYAEPFIFYFYDPPLYVPLFPSPDARCMIFYGRSPRRRGDGDTVRSSGSRTCKQVRLRDTTLDREGSYREDNRWIYASVLIYMRGVTFLENLCNFDFQ